MIFIYFICKKYKWLALPPEIPFEVVCGMDEASVATKISQMVLFYNNNNNNNSFFKKLTKTLSELQNVVEEQKEKKILKRRQRRWKEDEKKREEHHWRQQARVDKSGKWHQMSAILWFTLRNIYFDLCPYSGHRTPKTFFLSTISWVIRAISVCLLC